MSTAQYPYHGLSTSEPNLEPDTGNSETVALNPDQRQYQSNRSGVSPLEVSLTESESINFILSILANVLLYLIPTFIQELIVPRKSKPRHVGPTAFLDGLRGVAALLVVILHQMSDKPYWYLFPYYSGPYKEGEDPLDYTSLLQLPFVRALYNAGGMVSIFFVISGYVLSFRCVEIIRGVKKGNIAEKLFSSVFRRGGRLFLPSIAGLFLNEYWAMLGMYQFGPYDSPGLWGYLKDFWKWVGLFFAALWKMDQHDDVLMQFWTIPVEFVGSMALFLVIIGVSGLSNRMRIVTVLGLMAYVFHTHHTGFFCFFGGLLTAEIETIFTERTMANDAKAKLYPSTDLELAEIEGEKVELSASPRQRSHTLTSILYYLFWTALMLFAINILGWPVKGAEMDPLLANIVTHGTYDQWMAVGALCFVNCAFRLPFLKRVYTTPIALYLGDISYAIYIVHYALILHFEPIVQSQVNSVFGVGRKSHMSRFFGNFFEIALMLCIIVPVADLFWRIVDIPTVKFTRWVEQKCRGTYYKQEVSKRAQ